MRMRVTATWARNLANLAENGNIWRTAPSFGDIYNGQFRLVNDQLAFKLETISDKTCFLHSTSSHDLTNL